MQAIVLISLIRQSFIEGPSIPSFIYLPTTISLPTIGYALRSLHYKIVLALTPTSLFILYSSLHRSPFFSRRRNRASLSRPCYTKATDVCFSRYRAVLFALAASSFIECNEKERALYLRSTSVSLDVPCHPLFTQCSLCSFSASSSLRLFPLRRIKHIKSGLPLFLFLLLSPLSLPKRRTLAFCRSRAYYQHVMLSPYDSPFIFVYPSLFFSYSSCFFPSNENWRYHPRSCYRPHAIDFLSLLLSLLPFSSHPPLFLREKCRRWKRGDGKLQLQTRQRRLFNDHARTHTHASRQRDSNVSVGDTRVSSLRLALRSH